MTKPTDAIRSVIDESLAGQRDNFRKVLAARSTNEPLPVARTELLYVWDAYGNQFLDFGALNAPIGHLSPAVLGLVKDQMRYAITGPEQGSSLDRWPIQYAADLASSFSELWSGAQVQVLFCEGQHDAVSTAARMVWSSDRTRLTVLSSGLHDWLSPALGRVNHRSPLEVPHIGGWTGGLLVSPVTTSGHDIPALGEWISTARKAAVPVIVDETLSGFGRLGGSMWSRWAEFADAVILGGPVGAGLPLGAIVARRSFFTDRPGTVSPGPHAGSPVSCAAGSGQWAAITPDLLDNVVSSGEAMSGALDELVNQFPDLVSGHHGRGLYRALRFQNPIPDFHLHARRHGLLVAPTDTDTVILAPPLVISSLEARRGVDMLADTLLSLDGAGLR